MTWTSHAKAAGHPLHPILIVLPLGSSIAATVAGVAHFLGLGKSFPLHQIHYFNLLFCLGTGALAAVPGLIDTLYLPPNTRAKRVAWIHGIGNLAAIGLFGVSTMIQAGTKNRALTVGGFAFTAAGFALSGFTGFLGGELVERLGVSVDRTANLNAKLSLTHGDSPLSSERMTLNLGSIFATDHAIRDKAGELYDTAKNTDVKQEVKDKAKEYGLRGR